MKSINKLVSKIILFQYLLFVMSCSITNNDNDHKDSLRECYVTFKIIGEETEYTLYGTSFNYNSTSQVISSSHLNQYGFMKKYQRDLSKPGYVLNDWYFDKELTNLCVFYNTGFTGDTVLWAKRSCKTYKITYVLNNGSNHIANPKNYSINSEPIVLLPPVGGSSFIGWYNNPNFTGEPITVIPQGSVGDKTYYGSFLINNSVTFCSNLYTDGDLPIPVVGNFGDYITLPNSNIRGPVIIPDKIWQRFVRWNTKEDGTGTFYYPGGSYTIKYNTILYAQFTNDKVVTFCSNLYTDGDLPIPVVVGFNHSITLPNSNIRGPVIIPDKIWQRFVGWNTKEDGTGTFYNSGSSYTINQNINLYAQFTTDPDCTGKIGPAGGYVFYDAGSLQSWGRFMECQPKTSLNKPWGGYGTAVAGADGTAVGTGLQNTIDIVNQFGDAEPLQGRSDYAAKICYDMVYGGYDDWFLPSIDEAMYIYNNFCSKNIVGFYKSYYFWTSTENSNYKSRYIAYGVASGYKDSIYYILAVRAFD